MPPFTHAKYKFNIFMLKVKIKSVEEYAII